MQAFLLWLLLTAASGLGLLAVWLRAARRIADEDGVSWPRLLAWTAVWGALLYGSGERLMQSSAQALGTHGAEAEPVPRVSSP